jgi:hypothetical protein
LKRLQFIVFFLLLLAGSVGYGQQPARGYDIRDALRRYGQAEVAIKYPGYDAMTELASRFSVSSCDGSTSILCLSPRTVEDFINSGIEYSLMVPEHKGFYTASSAAEAMLWQSYPTWKHYDTIMHKIAERWPDLCLLDTIGFSVMGRAVLAMKISDNPGDDEHEPAVMLSASIHGDEPASFVLLMRLAEYLACETENGGIAADLTSGLEIWINPLANPDGMYRNNDTMINPVRVNSNGYDLNRNFPDPEVTAPDPLQPETLDMISFMEEKHFVLSANLHSGAEVVNYPWDKWTRLHADDEWFNDISRRYADTVHMYADDGYMTFLDDGVTRGWAWYTVRGGRQDFITWGLGGREVTIELDNTKMTSGSRLETLWNWNYRSLIRYLAEALNGVRGTVTDADTGDSLCTRIFIQGHDRDSSHVFSDTITGAYYRYLAPGTYDLTFTCQGYQPYEYQAVISDWNTLLTEDVQLVREEIDYPDPPKSGLLIWPNPSDGHISIMPPSSVSGEIVITVSSISGSVIESRSMTSQPGIPVTFDMSRMPPGIYVLSVERLPYGPVVRGRAVVSKLISR